MHDGVYARVAGVAETQLHVDVLSIRVWRESAVRSNPIGKVVFRGCYPAGEKGLRCETDGVVVRAASLAEARGLARWALSVSHDGGMANPFVVAMSEGLGGAY